VSGPTGPPPATPDPPPTTRTTRAEESRGTPEFSPTAVQAQYLAYVRAKISRTNERIMPRDWIRDVLRDKVSSEFVVQLRRDGEVQSAILTRSSGFAVLDAKAREAIYIARPFEGYPPNAGDTLTVTVTVFYAPIYR
jgi:TonB family protein